MENWCFLQEQNLSHSLLIARMPPEMEGHATTVWSLNTPGKRGTNEAADFKLEEVNKQIQHWIPKVPSGSDWTVVCYNYNTLINLRETTFNQIGIKDPKNRSIHLCKDMRAEIDVF